MLTRQPLAPGAAFKGLRVLRSGRFSGREQANLSARCRRRSAAASSMTLPSEEMRPPSNAAVIFLRPTAGNENGKNVSSVMAGVARAIWSEGQASTTESYAISIA